MSELVSVILPVYNAEEYIRDCLQSLVNQTYANLEIIVINDGSTDNSEIIIRDFLNDPRLIFISRPNQGLVYSLNEGINLASGKYIARMDADDICNLSRICTQVDFFKRNPNYGLLGTRVKLINKDGNVIGKCFRPKYDKRIRTYSLYGSPFAHPTVMFNLNVIPKDKLIYKDSCYPVEDLNLWLELISDYKCANLEDRLLYYRIIETSISSNNSSKQKSMSLNLREAKYIDEPLIIKFIRTLHEPENISIIHKFLISWHILIDKRFSMLEVIIILLKSIRRSRMKSLRE